MKPLAALLIAVSLTACSSSYSQSPLALPAASQLAPMRHKTGSYPITHIVIIMQENRSFDNLFHGFPKADSAMFGYGHGVKYKLQPLPLAWTHDMNHMRFQFLEDYDGGKNDGFDDQIRDLDPSCQYADPYNHPSCWTFWTGKKYLQMAFSYVEKSQVQPYWTMASEYALGDHNFASTNGPSFGRASDADRRSRRARRRSSEQNAVGLRRTQRKRELPRVRTSRPARIPAGIRPRGRGRRSMLHVRDGCRLTGRKTDFVALV